MACEIVERLYCSCWGPLVSSRSMSFSSNLSYCGPSATPTNHHPLYSGTNKDTFISLRHLQNEWIETCHNEYHLSTTTNYAEIAFVCISILKRMHPLVQQHIKSTKIVLANHMKTRWLSHFSFERRYHRSWAVQLINPLASAPILAMSPTGDICPAQSGWNLALL